MPADFVWDRDSPVRVRILYAYQDSELLPGLENRLKAASGDVTFEVSSQLELLPGDAFEERMAEWLKGAQIILLLVSDAFLASRRAKIAVEAALSRRRSGQVAVVPVILTYVNWWHVTWANLEALPQGVRPVVDWPNLDDAFDSITSSLIELVKYRRNRERPHSTIAEYISEPKFLARWLTFSLSLLVGSLLFLGWYSAHPATQIKSESPAAGFLLNSAVVGVAAMSLVQIARRLFRVRGAFHRDAANAWLDRPAMSDLHARVRTGRIDEMFDLPSEMLAGQLSAIAEQALEEQASNAQPSPLVRGMAEGAEPSVRNAAAVTSESAPDSRASLALAIQRNLDHFQIATAASWRRYLLLTSILLSLALFTLGLQIFQAGSFIPGLKAHPITFPDRLGNFTALLACAILVGLFGGFLGSIARDVVAIIEKLRR